MLTKHVALLLALSILSGSIPVQARKKDGESDKERSGRTRIEGRVFRADGETAIAQATIRFVPLQPDMPTTTAACNDQGEFVAEGVPVGYVDLIVESEGAAYVGNQVLNVAPAGKQELRIVLARREERTASWWSGREMKPLPGGRVADGIAEIRPKVGGKDFWKSPKGLAVLGGIGAAVLLGIASGGGSNASASQ